MNAKLETTVLCDGTQWGVCEESGGDMVAECFGPNAEKNANLFAAAPELLAALVEYVDRHEAEGNPTGTPEYERACAALAKARDS